ncbi:DUF805 domain-containing protein [Lactobacillus sp. S2-2]|uniref:DUF805 domain-containing protein n=1 Tax=Lactobacillus sp. S2-2 TaxID=2692917 RepID=UPI001F1C97B9|nr:DUF805 domain-containing protein [Lactobacillus sp. S2-2]MCF6515491.1 DUF805 domain-containing protein [Lactobacillus sp. S2-2]
MINSYKIFWTRLLNFSGTSTRLNYWVPVIINWLIGGILISIIQGIIGHPINDIYTFTDLNLSVGSQIIAALVWIAMLSLTIRRLHDSDHSGFWIFIQFIPLLGQIWFIILMILPSKKNRWSEI